MVYLYIFLLYIITDASILFQRTILRTDTHTYEVKFKIGGEWQSLFICNTASFFFLLLSVWKMSFNAVSQFEMNPQSWDRNLMFRFRNKMSNWQRHCSPNVLTFDWWALLQTCQTRQVSNFSSSISLTPPTPRYLFTLMKTSIRALLTSSTVGLLGAKFVIILLIARVTDMASFDWAFIFNCLVS